MISVFGRKKIDEHQMNAKQHIIIHTSRRIGENVNVLCIPESGVVVVSSANTMDALAQILIHPLHLQCPYCVISIILNFL